MMSRRSVRVIMRALCVAALAMTPLTSVSASTVPGGDGLSLPPGYVDAVNHALSQKTDYFGEQLMAQPDGPTLQGVRDRLVPVNGVGTYLTASGWYYLPLTMPRPDPNNWDQQRDFSLHVADGSQLLSGEAEAAGVIPHSFDTCNEASQCVTFYVGSDDNEVFGSDRSRLEPPRLADGYLPILENGYTDAAGVRYHRESFASRPSPDGPVVSLLHFTVDNPGALSPGQPVMLRINFQRPGSPNLVLQGNRLTDGTRTYLAFTGDGTWNSPNLTIRLDPNSPDGIYLAVPNQPAATLPPLTSGTYTSERAKVASYWRQVLSSGAHVQLPEKYVQDAMKNVLMQNLVMAWRLSIGNAYEAQGQPDFAYIPEQTPAVTVLGEFGFAGDYKDDLQQLLSKGQGPAYFPTWEEGIKLESAAHYYGLTGDASFLRENLQTFEAYLNDIHQQQLADPNGLLSKERTASDIAQPIYGLHSLTDVWQGLRDMGAALQMAGDAQDAQGFTDEAATLHASLERAVTESEQTLSDGSLYVPMSLLDPNADPAYDFISATRSGSYWNLLAPYAFATGFFPPYSDQAKGILTYLYNHGSQFLGLPRFNYTGTAVGDCNTGFPAGIEGYKTPGWDAQYGYSMLQFLAQNSQYDRITLALYGKLGGDMTPFTFINGEGTTIGPCPQLGEYYRTTWLAPLAGNNATFLEALRLALVNEQLNSDGAATTLDVAPATPRSWLESGKRIGVTALPTLFGPLSYQITSHLDRGFITATITPPKAQGGQPQARDVVLYLRAPGKISPRLVLINGQAEPVAQSGDAIHLGSITHQTTVTAYYSTS